jgi:hypothetical protein
MTQLIKIPGITNPVALDAPIYAGSNFTWREATHDGERLPQRTNFQGRIFAAEEITGNIIKQAKELDRLRVFFGSRPIIITSWYRPPAVNRAVGGARWSQHILGWGTDWKVHGMAPMSVSARLEANYLGGVGRNRYYTHTDLRHLLGWEAASWDYGRSA